MPTTRTPALLWRSILAFGWFCCGLSAFTAEHQLGKPTTGPRVAPASDEAELAIKKFRVPKGFKVDLVAAEPDLANPVAFCVDEQGRFYVAETFRLFAGVLDIRGRRGWPDPTLTNNLTAAQLDELSDAILNTELASRSVADRIAMYQRFMGPSTNQLAMESERVKLIEDRDADGKADHSTVFAEGFNHVEDGIGAGVLARKGTVYYSCIPDLWALRDTSGDGVADVRKSLSTGYGVRVGFLGHDLHGLRIGPDGRLYFTIGDRGAVVHTPDGRTLSNPDTGAVYRCNQDGTGLEIFATGLRNPQELVFDQYGNLWTGDNNSDSGDRARWVYLVEGGDSGWQVGYQFMEQPYSRGAFNAEKIWYPHWAGQAAYIVPPIANIANGPSGVAYNPGTGLPGEYAEHFFLADFRGGEGSRIYSFAMKPKGAYFELVDQTDIVSGILPTDVDFGTAGGLYWTDWVQGWDKTGKGRIYRAHDPSLDSDPLIVQTRRLIGEGMTNRSIGELTTLMAFPDLRVRQEAQFELADRALAVGGAALPIARTLSENEPVNALQELALRGTNQLARLHALWGLGQTASRLPQGQRQQFQGLAFLLPLLHDPDPEIRAQAAKVLAEAGVLTSFPELIALLKDSDSRVRFFAAMGVGKLIAGNKSWHGAPSIVGPIFDMIIANNEEDPYLRHAGVMALVWNGDRRPLLEAAGNPNPSVRIASVVALRRMQRPEVSRFLKDPDPRVVVEAARAINDVPISGATPELAAILTKAGLDEPTLRRTINANFEIATAQGADALAAFASRSEAADIMRIEALETLGEWAKPTGRDRVTGLWRLPLPRDISTAQRSLQSVWNDIVQHAPDEVKIAAVQAATKLGLTTSAPSLFTMLSDSASPPLLRLVSLRGLAQFQAVQLPEAVTIAASSTNEVLRKEATLLQALVKPADASSKLVQVLQTGTVGEKQAALQSLGDLQDPQADKILSKWLDDLLAGRVEKELFLELIEAASKRGNPELKQKVESYTASLPKDDPMAEYRIALYGGDPKAGQKIFAERPEAACVRCHKVAGEGGEVGPDLTGIGSRQTRDYLLESVLFPNRQIAKGFETLLVTLKNGTTYAGIVKSQNDQELVINSPEDGIVKVKPSDIQTRDRGLSPMPEGLGSVLSKADLRNLVEFLAQQKN